MYCTNCGSQRGDQDFVCPKCQRQIQTFAAPPAINNYLVPSILVTLCCCLPAGIVGLVYGAQVNTKIVAGDIEGAKRSASQAKTWVWIGVVLGILLYAVSFGSGVLDAIAHR